MEPVSGEVIDQSLKILANMNEKESTKASERFVKEQPDLMAYLTAVDGEIFDEEDREVMLSLGITIWYIMSAGKLSLPRATRDSTMKSVDANLKWLEQFAGKKDSVTEKGITNLLKNYPQPGVLLYVLEALADEGEDQSQIHDENKIIMFMDLKTVVDCLNG